MCVCVVFNENQCNLSYQKGIYHLCVSVVCLSVCLSVYLSIYLSIYLSYFQCSTCYWFSVTLHYICPFIASSNSNFFCFITLSTSFSHLTSSHHHHHHHHHAPSDHVIVHLGRLWCDPVTGLVYTMFWRPVVLQHSATFWALCSIVLPWQLACS
jgi:hypothetical protein